MSLTLVTGGEPPTPADDACPQQLALFGDPVPFSELPSIHDTLRPPSPPAGEDDDPVGAFDHFDTLQQQLDLLLDGFDDTDVPAAAAGTYVDGDGRVRTRFRLLRAV